MHKSSKWLIWEICLVFLIVVLLGILDHPLILTYQRHKLLHILGAILLLGNIIITAVWMLMAERTNNYHVMRFAVFSEVSSLSLPMQDPPGTCLE